MLKPSVECPRCKHQLQPVASGWRTNQWETITYEYVCPQCDLRVHWELMTVTLMSYDVNVNHEEYDHLFLDKCPECGQLRSTSGSHACGTTLICMNDLYPRVEG